MPQVEEAQQIWDSWTVAGFEEAQEEARAHHLGEGEGSGLAGSYDAPADDAEGGPHVWWDDLPHQGKPFEDDVGDVEDGQEPLVVGGGEMEVFFHSCNLGISRERSGGFRRGN